MANLLRGYRIRAWSPPVQQKYLSLEGYTVNAPGNARGQQGTPSVSGWRAIRPRRWRREPRRKRNLRGCDGLKVQSNPTKEGLRTVLLNLSILQLIFCFPFYLRIVKREVVSQYNDCCPVEVC